MGNGEFATDREIGISIREGLHAAGLAPSRIASLLHIKIERASNDWEEQALSETIPLSERFTGPLTAEDISDLLQEAAFKIIPYLTSPQLDYEKGLLSPVLLDDEGQPAASVIIDFEDLNPLIIGRPVSVCLVTGNEEEAAISGLNFETLQHPHLLAPDRIRDIRVMKVLFPGAGLTKDDITETHISTAGGHLIDDSYLAPEKLGVHTVIKPQTREGDELTKMLYYLDRIVAELLPPEHD